MSCKTCGCKGFCCPDRPVVNNFCTCCARTLVDILNAIITQFPLEQLSRIFLPGPAGQIINPVPIQIRNGFLLEVLEGADQRIVNICDIVAITGIPINNVDLSNISTQENCNCCEQALTDLMTLISSVPNRSFDMNTQSQQAGSISSSNPTDVFSGVVRVTTGNNKTVISLCQVSSVDRITPPV